MCVLLVLTLRILTKFAKFRLVARLYSLIVRKLSGWLPYRCVVGVHAACLQHLVCTLLCWSMVTKID